MQRGWPTWPSRWVYWPRLKSCYTACDECARGEISLRWRHSERDGVSKHQLHDCLFNRLFRRRSKKTSKLRVTGLCAGNSPVTGEFPAHMASNAESVSIWWRHHVFGAVARWGLFHFGMYADGVTSHKNLGCHGLVLFFLRFHGSPCDTIGVFCFVLFCFLLFLGVLFFLNTECTGCCQNDNFHFSQWRKPRQKRHPRFSEQHFNLIISWHTKQRHEGPCDSFRNVVKFAKVTIIFTSIGSDLHKCTS